MGGLRAVLLFGSILLASLPVAWGFHEHGGQTVSDPTVMSEAERLYVNHDLHVFQASSSAFSAAFPAYQLYSVVERGHHQATRHAMAFDPSLGKGFDITRDFNLLTPASAPTTATTATDVARAYADAANTELQPHRDVVVASDSGWLGRTVTDPAASAVVGGWRVSLWTWSGENGVLASWTVEFGAGQLTKGEWLVDSLLRGPPERSFEAVPLLAGTTITNSYAAVYTLQATQAGQMLLLPTQVKDLTFYPVNSRTNFDGTTWRVSFAGVPDIAVNNLATSLLDAGAEAYSGFVRSSTCSSVANPAPNWGFRVRDPDCDLEIRIVPSTALYCGACLDRGNDTRLYFSQDLEPYVLTHLQWYRNAASYNRTDVARLALRHELLTSLVSYWPSDIPDVLPPAGGLDYLRSDGRVDPEHAAIRIVLDPAFQRLRAYWRASSSLLELVPALNGTLYVTVALQCLSGGLSTCAAPYAAGADSLTPSAWRTEVNITRFAPANLVAPTGSTRSTPQTGAAREPTGPGSKIWRTKNWQGDEVNDLLCTTSFLWTNATKTELFVSTAGHCLITTSSVYEPVDDGTIVGNPTRVSTVAGKYPTYRPPGFVEAICVQDCSRGVASDQFAELCPEGGPCVSLWTAGKYQDFGATTYADYAGTGKDFGVAKVNSAWFDPQMLQATVQYWGGPTSAGCTFLNTQFPQLVVLYGNGAVAGEDRIAKPRAGFFMGPCWTSTNLNELKPTLSITPVAPGDSGSPHLLGQFDQDLRVVGTSALGTLSGRNPNNPLVTLTSINYAKAVVKADIGVDLFLVCSIQGWETCG